MKAKILDENKSTNTINVDAIESHLSSQEMGKTICYHAEVTSTNIVAKELADEGNPSGTLVVADFQSQGKGRRGRTWVAPKGEDIFMSILLRPQIQSVQASMLTLVMGLSVAQAVNDCLGIESQIKWPNDVVVKGKKICGILTEMSAKTLDVTYVVIGTGINCNTKQFVEEGLSNATSLALETGKDVDREALIAKVMSIFEENFNRFLETKDLTKLQDKYNQLLANNDREVVISGSGEAWSGVARGINELGELLVEDKNGEIKAIFTGEVSVRGIYGYV